MIKIALAGNPNSGKTTLFNALTGSSQYVGNWPGVTVEKKEGTLKGNKQVIIQDLPGIYSLSPYRPEEIAARNYLADEKPDALINIVDASNLERNLYLTSQLLELDIPMVIALNMMDVVESRNDKIDSQGLSKRLGCPVIEMSAARGTGIKEVTAAAIKAASHHDQASPHEFSQPIEKALNSISVLTRPEMDRWFAVKVFENDEKAIERLKPNPAQTEKAAEIRQTWERCWHFLKKAGTILFVCCVITWFLVSYGFDADGFGMVDVQDSLLAAIGSSLTWLFAPLGWSNWQTVAASLSGFVAKEQIVSTMGVLVNVADETGEVPELWNAVMVMFPSAAAAVSFLIFNLLDAPCLAAVSTMIKEMNSRKWAWFAFEWQMFYAWTMALMVYQLSSWVLYGTFGFWTVIALFLLAWYIWMIFRPMPEAEDRKSSAKTVKSAA